ncbi:hydrogenase maturation nickel metallochaperone HypA [Chloroflexota bacterium]
MHELSITQSILSIALEKANEVQASKVTKINLIIGELSGVVSKCVEFYFDLLSKDTIAAQASLSFHQPPTQLRCRGCAAVFSPNGLGWACPICQEQKIEIISGRECHVDSMEVD